MIQIHFWDISMLASHFWDVPKLSKIPFVTGEYVKRESITMSQKITKFEKLIAKLV